MKNTLKGLVAGILIGTTITGGAVFARTGTETLEAIYNNIKIYVDGIKIDPKDATGKEVEPFIYNGTTYLPVRAVGEAIGKTVSWDGATQSVYLGEKPGDVQYLMDVCPPYETFDEYKEYTQTNEKYFSMAGKKYTNGFHLEASYSDNGYALINLDGKYSTIEFDVGHIDGEPFRDTVLIVYKDGKKYKEYDLLSESLPNKITLPVSGCLQLKFSIEALGSNNAIWGFGNITVK